MVDVIGAIILIQQYLQNTLIEKIVQNQGEKYQSVNQYQATQCFHMQQPSQVSHLKCKVKICMSNERISTHTALVPDSSYDVTVSFFSLFHCLVEPLAALLWCTGASCDCGHD